MNNFEKSLRDLSVTPDSTPISAAQVHQNKLRRVNVSGFQIASRISRPQAAIRELRQQFADLKN
jgi:hypothetical protein